MSSRKISLFYVVLIALASMAVTAVITSKMDLTPVSSAQTVAVPSTNSAPLTGAIDATTFRNIAKVTAPAVVNIQTLGHARGRDLTEYFGGQGDDLLRRFFGGGDDQAPRGGGGGRSGRGQQRNQAPEISGAGTGFIVDKTGFILTNNHVVEDADDIRVSLYGAERGETYAAKVIGRDVLTDCALIQMTELPKQPLTEVHFGDSDQMQPGDWVMAIGNPFGLAHTVSVGVISGTQRPFETTQQRFAQMLQTDAAINPGNSGGPLLNVRGEVVGINTAIYTDAARQGNIGIGFAMPINVVRELLPQLRTGKITRGRIGVEVSAIRRDDIDALGLKTTDGALVRSVSSGGAAGKAGMKPGDVIVAFNGKPVKKNDDLVSMVMATKPGTTVPIRVRRGTSEQTLSVTVDELDLEAESQQTRNRDDNTNEPQNEATAGFGMSLSNITADVARRLRLQDNTRGALVVDVDASSPAARAGLQPGDVIIDVNRQPVTNSAEAQRELAKVASGRSASLVVIHQGQERFVIIKKD
ncbi:MAG TPA: Do family serine endopeptidase [Vicinamibacterales bacterium]|nr:Do family serine endopeptidase [Vicinamibacterales bacterium]